VEEVAAVRGIGPGLARAVVEALAADAPAAAVDMATGEVLPTESAADR